ncbi:SIR2 family protein [Stagnimonas aquatica]|uniref:SIR2 family protein n=1 Tax=Stagnimonas aquatica TaxID=2689987 RepID=A0A3N0VG82_9GAMM|nr:SIR2 family protein [Stagnimonas aquatica]ROH91756.1 SIR2 family protein [Stagnimonas aquatica]
MQSHDPNRQLGFIQQALSQNRKPLGFFIGAGCPLSVRITREIDGTTQNLPLIWDVAGLTKVIGDRLRATEGAQPSNWDKMIAIVREDGGNEMNIELILSKIRAFISVAGKGNVRGMAVDDLTTLDSSICKVISEEVERSLPNNQTPYHNLAVWIRSIHREKPVHLFTTNYDLLLEQALEESSAPYFDGFIGARKAFFDLGAVEDENLLPPRWTRLWKIHGSLNWRLENKNNVVRSDIKSENQSYLIYPSHLKYDQSRKMPYLAMLDRLKSFLLSPSAVVFICGYSFGDEHINDIICRSLETNPTAHVFAFLFGALEDPKYMHGKIWAEKTPNLSLLAFDKAIIGRNIGAWKTDNPTALSLPVNVLVSSGEDISLKLGDFSAFGNLLRALSGAQDSAHETE